MVKREIALRIAFRPQEAIKAMAPTGRKANLLIAGVNYPHSQPWLNSTTLENGFISWARRHNAVAKSSEGDSRDSVLLPYRRPAQYLWRLC